MAIKFITTVLTLLCLKTSYANEDGAPVEACNGMLPGHAPFQAQIGNSPYVINAQNTGSQGVVTVEITSSAQRPFKGFFLKAIHPNFRGDVRQLGEFVNFHNFAKKVECPQAQALTHQDPQPKVNLKFIWQAKQNGPVQFKATVVEAYDIFYTDILSPVIHL